MDRMANWLQAVAPHFLFSEIFPFILISFCLELYWDLTMKFQEKGQIMREIGREMQIDT